jgi:hypothetical protein
MKKAGRYLSMSLALLLVLGGVAFTADQTILGRSLVVKDPGAANKRKVTNVAKEKQSLNTIVGNPTLSGSAGGAILTIFVDGASSANQSFVLNQGTSTTGKSFWTTAGTTGFKYRDPRGDQGPVKVVLIKRSGSGAFSVKAVVTGKNGPVTIAPPNPGTEGCVTLKLGVGNTATGDRYHMKYGPDGIVKNSGSKLFKVTKPLTEGLCPGAPPPSSTTTTTTTTTMAPSSTTTTTLYGSPSRAFLVAPADLLE